jgi:hypothetical protein
MGASHYLAGDIGRVTFTARLAARGISLGFWSLGHWPERGMGVT